MTVTNEGEDTFERIAYIEKMLQELVKIAAETDDAFLTYLLKIAQQEARDSATARGRSVQ